MSRKNKQKTQNVANDYAPVNTADNKSSNKSSNCGRSKDCRSNVSDSTNCK